MQGLPKQVIVSFGAAQFAALLLGGAVGALLSRAARKTVRKWWREK